MNLLIVARGAELPNDDAAERHQGALPLFARQLIPELVEDRQVRRARGGTAVATGGMGLLLGSRVGAIASIVPAEAGRRVRLWASPRDSVKGREWV